LCLDKKIKIVKVKENECKEKRREYMIGVFPKRKTLKGHEESHGNRNMTAYTIVLDHII